MEGVAFGLRDSVELLSSEVELGEVRVSGGGASSKVWLGILADVLERPLRIVGTAESAAHGAAILAATGAGAFASVTEACTAAVELGDVIEPSTSAASYVEAYGVYRDLYPQLRQTFPRLSVLDA